MRIAVTVLAFCVAALLALGMVMLYSSSMYKPGAHFLTTQLLWCGLGVALCVTAASVDYGLLKKIALPILIIALVLLALVLVPRIGIKINGARRWLGYGSARFQSSEFAKLALIIALAWYGERYQRQMRTWKRGVMIPALMVMPVVALIFVEPDRGATVLLAGVSGAMLLIAGVRWMNIAPLLVVALAGLGYSLWHDPLRRKRIWGWLNLEEGKNDVSYQAYQAMLALGAGGWTGLGLGNGRQKLGFVPENHTDFILSVIGEELGLVATLLVVVAFVAIVLCGLFIARNARETFGLLLGAGVSLLIGLQAFINIGVVSGALPNKGLPLPFVSYGGSNLLIMLTSVGLLLSIARHSRVGDSIAVGSQAREIPAAQAT